MQKLALLSIISTVSFNDSFLQIVVVVMVFLAYANFWGIIFD